MGVRAADRHSAFGFFVVNNKKIGGTAAVRQVGRQLGDNPLKSAESV
jgi:hypothetical protein